MEGEVFSDHAFCYELNGFLKDYEVFLAAEGFTNPTILKRLCCLRAFFWFLYGYTSVQGFEDITKAMLNSKFRAYLKNDHKDEFTDSFIRKGLKGYFSFIYERYGISTPLIKSTLGIH